MNAFSNISLVILGILVCFPGYSKEAAANLKQSVKDAEHVAIGKVIEIAKDGTVSLKIDKWLKGTPTKTGTISLKGSTGFCVMQRSFKDFMKRGERYLVFTFPNGKLGRLGHYQKINPDGNLPEGRPQFMYTGGTDIRSEKEFVSLIKSLVKLTVEATKNLATLNLYPVLRRYSTGTKGVSIAVEIKNNSTTPKTFIIPQDGSYWGWLDPHYLFTIKGDNKEVMKLPGRCGVYGGKYDKTTMKTIEPGQSFYVLANGLPYQLKKQKELTLSLQYTVSNPKQKANGQGKDTGNWPADVFVGKIKSIETFFNLDDKYFFLAKENEKLEDPKEPGPINDGISIWLRKVRKVQEWGDIKTRVVVTRASMKKHQDLIKKKWKVKAQWLNEKGEPVTHFDYSGDNHYFRGKVPAERWFGYEAYFDTPLGFQKKAGKYKVYLTLEIEGHGKLRSNTIDIEVARNLAIKLTKTWKTEAPKK